QPLDLTARRNGGDVGELAPEAHLDPGDLRPASPRADVETLLERGLGGRRRCRHAVDPARSACRSLVSRPVTPTLIRDVSVESVAEQGVPVSVAVEIGLTDSERDQLTALIRAGRTEQRLARRAMVVLSAARGASNASIAASTGLCVDTVWMWRGRWAAAPG